MTKKAKKAKKCENCGKMEAKAWFETKHVCTYCYGLLQNRRKEEEKNPIPRNSWFEQLMKIQKQRK